MRALVASRGREPEIPMHVFVLMDYGVGIAGLSLLGGLLAVFASVIAVGVALQLLKGPDDRRFSR
jgi:hypothetical protein